LSKGFGQLGFFFSEFLFGFVEGLGEGVYFFVELVSVLGVGSFSFLCVVLVLLFCFF
jgi:hypothetical protein